MKKITNLLIVCSLALAGAVMAQQPAPEESQSPGKKTDKKAPAEVKPKAKAPKSETPAAAPKTEAPAVKEPAAATKPKSEAPASAPKTEAPAATEPAATKPDKKAKADKKTAPATTAPETKPSAEQPATSAAPADKKQSRKDKKAADTNAKTSPTPAAAASTAPSTPAAKTTPAAATAPTVATTPATTPAPTIATTPATAGPTGTAATTASVAPATAPSASVAPSVSQTTTTAAVKKPDPQKVEQIRQRTATFTAQPRPDRVPAVTFTAGYRIQGADQWQGPRYEVYRSYRPERHDQGWYRSRYTRVELIAGGYYYFHNNYWYPAWGYSPREEYYAYDAPIYAGKRALPPDKVIAEVQAVLQDMGYYKGEVDGLLGPLTREALTGYQRDNGMTVTAVIDEPTLDSLGMS